MLEHAWIIPTAVSQLLTALEDTGLRSRGRLENDRRRQPLALVICLGNTVARACMTRH
jgi:DNA-binding MarR family transcriptional regulator